MQIFHRSIAHFFEKLLHLRRLAVLIIGVIASEPTAPFSGEESYNFLSSIFWLSKERSSQ